MRKTLLTTAFAIVLSIAHPASAHAWGFAAHRLIMSRAIALLPPELKPFFERFEQELLVRVTDPDQWRDVGWEDDPNHFVNFGARELGAYPFNELPRDYSAALAKFGIATLKRDGMLPWREDEEFGNLRRTFEGFKRQSPSPDTLVLFAAVASHYMQDAHQPLHATDNYDGAQTGNNGVHARFERELIERFGSMLNLHPGPLVPITNARDAAFDALLSSYKDVPLVLAADTKAVAGKTMYDDDYFRKFFDNVRPVLEERLSSAITATANLIVGAWEQAGRPTLTLQPARPAQPVRQSR